jgi:putative DNA primase/helicase
MPEAVKAATTDYFAQQDTLAHWLAERCEAKFGAGAPSSALFRDWQAWAGGRVEEPGTAKGFSSALGWLHAKKRTNAGLVFIGLRLLPSATGVF